jgi:hypothetical protein
LFFTTLFVVYREILSKILQVQIPLFATFPIGTSNAWISINYAIDSFAYDNQKASACTEIKVIGRLLTDQEKKKKKNQEMSPDCHVSPCHRHVLHGYWLIIIS